MRRRNTNTNSKCNANRNGPSDTNANTNCHSKTYSDAQAAPNSKNPPNASAALKVARCVRRRKKPALPVRTTIIDYTSNKPCYEPIH
jgi:hypothetical protein